MPSKSIASPPSLPTRRIGTTDIYLTELGLGCAAMTGNMGPVPDYDIRDAIATSFDLGVRYADTAPLYGFGRSEHMVGDALRNRDDITLSTKVGRVLLPGPATPDDARFWDDPYPFCPVFDYTYDGVMRSYEDSLQRLGLDQIDLLLLHDIGAMQHGAANDVLFATAMEGGYLAMAELRQAGDVKAIGLGVNEGEVCMAAMNHGEWDCFLLAGRYTILEQDPVEDLLPACARAGTSLIIGGPFNSGILAAGSTWNCEPAPSHVVAKKERLQEVCRSHGVPLPAAAIQFPLGADVVSSVIPGPRSGSQARDLVDWYRFDIPPSLWSDLKSEGLLHPCSATP